MNPVDHLLAALADHPNDDTAWFALADALDEQGDSARAEVTRLSLWLRRRLDDPEHAACGSMPAGRGRRRGITTATLRGR
jgi:uncharacterized protein (TIGR02996 family)